MLGKHARACRVSGRSPVAPRCGYGAAVATIRAARAEDAQAIAAIWRAGIEERVATFETRRPVPGEVAALISSGALVLVAEERGRATAFAKVGPYDDPHDYYAGIGEATLYVSPEARGHGVGRELLEALAAEAERAGYHKLIGKVFADNTASIGLVRGCGFREVGLHHRHGTLDGEWKDVLVVERLLGGPG
jgi:L-amino acid N-acyltransferase YncA